MRNEHKTASVVAKFDDFARSIYSCESEKTMPSLITQSFVVSASFTNLSAFQFFHLVMQKCVRCWVCSVWRTALSLSLDVVVARWCCGIDDGVVAQVVSNFLSNIDFLFQWYRINAPDFYQSSCIRSQTVWFFRRAVYCYSKLCTERFDFCLPAHSSSLTRQHCGIVISENSNPNLDNTMSYSIFLLSVSFSKMQHTLAPRRRVKEKKLFTSLHLWTFPLFT